MKRKSPNRLRDRELKALRRAFAEVARTRTSEEKDHGRSTEAHHSPARGLENGPDRRAAGDEDGLLGGGKVLRAVTGPAPRTADGGRQNRPTARMAE